MHIIFAFLVSLSFCHCSYVSGVRSTLENLLANLIFNTINSNTIAAQFEDMKFGLMPSSSQSTVAISITNTLYSNTTTSRPQSVTSSRKNSYNNNNNNNGININNNNNINMSIMQINATSDFNQWLHAMKMVAGLPGGTPPEFRRKVKHTWKLIYSLISLFTFVCLFVAVVSISRSSLTHQRHRLE